MKITRLCKEFGVLPEPGGLLQQSKGTISRIEAALNATSKYEEVEMKRKNT